MTAILDLVNLADNPVFHRFRRSQLRIRKALFWYLATLIVTTFAISLSYILQTTVNGMAEEAAARNLWIPLLIIQGLILLLKGTGRTSAGLIQDKIDETLDYQRLTPVSPLRNLIGYLFGLPLLEYVMVALTLPHLVFIVVKGNIPLGTVLGVYLVFFVCAIFYHMTAIAVGMVIKRWIWGYLLSIVSVAFLNMILPTVASQLGLKFLQYLSIIPVIGQKVVPLTETGRALAAGRPPFGPQGPPGNTVSPEVFGNGFGPPQPAFSFADPVPFFEWTLSPFLFTLLLQGLLIVTLTTMAVRRWTKSTKHSLSKPYALGMLAVFVVLVAGNLWPAITGDRLPFALFGSTEINDLSSRVLAIGLPLVYSLAIWLLCIFLYMNTVPTHHSYVRGVRRARKLGRAAARPWDDDAAHLGFLTLFTVIALIGFQVLYSQMQAAGFMGFLDGTGVVHWRLPLVLGLVLIYSLLLVLVLELRGTVLTVLLIWLLPILVAIVSAAAMEDVTRMHSVIACLSPLATLIVTGLLPLEGAFAFPSNDELEIMQTGANTGLALVGLQIVALAARWQFVRRALR